MQAELCAAILLLRIASSDIGELKKRIFYGKKKVDASHIKFEHDPDMLNGPGYAPEVWIRLLHSVIGTSSELDELWSALLLGDQVGLLEEQGDIYWYAGQLHNVLGRDPEITMEVNIAKLRQRYPNAFNDEDALVRDTEAERQILES